MAFGDSVGFADGTGEGACAGVPPAGTEGPSLTPSKDFLPQTEVPDGIVPAGGGTGWGPPSELHLLSFPNVPT